MSPWQYLKECMKPEPTVQERINCDFDEIVERYSKISGIVDNQNDVQENVPRDPYFQVCKDFSINGPMEFFTGEDNEVTRKFKQKLKDEYPEYFI